MAFLHGIKVLTAPRQVEAISSPLRMEILEHLLQAGPSSVADLARLMGRPATAIHYHVSVLRGAGIVRVAGRRRAGKRHEALLELAAARFAVKARTGDTQALGQVLRTLGATLRLAQREAARTMRDPKRHTPGMCGDGARRTFHTRRLRAPLSPSALRIVNHLLDELDRVFAQAVRQHFGKRRSLRTPSVSVDNIVSLTFVLTPAGRSATRKRK